MTLILAIDAAWTDTEPSGVALLAATGFRWNCLSVAPSYDAFIECARGTHIDWDRRNFRGSRPDVPELLRAARTIAGTDVDLVAVDMPVATIPFSARRAADNAISIAFGARGCSAHSPSTLRPGALGAELTDQFCKARYQLVTSLENSPATRRFIEVYPHPALLALLRASYRIPYKVQKSSRYWPGVDARERIVRLLSQFADIHAAVGNEIEGVSLALPTAATVPSLSSLKRYEDALDALVCGWVAAQFAQGNAIPYGDATAAVWVPKTGLPCDHAPELAARHERVMDKASVPAMLRQQIDRWAESWLTAKFTRLLELRARDPGPFNYPIEVFAEWRGKAFYLNVRYRARSRKVEDDFIVRHTRMTLTGFGRFDLAYFRHTDKWFTVYRGLTAADCFREIEENEIFWPTT